MPLKVAAGYSSLTGPRERNEDFCGVATPEGLELENKGVIPAVADGIGGHKGGREAAEYTVRGLLGDYYATPDTWSVPRAIETVTTALNRWVIAEGSRNAELAGMATTLSALVLRGRRYYTAHIGDSRIYRVQGGRLAALTVDHIWEHPELRNVLSPAVALDPRVLLDFSDGELTVDDRFLLVSDGVWGVLPDALMADVLLDHPEPQAAAAALTSLALGQVNALDYLLKPIQAERLSETISKILEKEKNKATAVRNADKKLGLNDQVFVKDGDRCWFVSLSNVRLFESDGNYIKVYFDNNRPMIHKSLNALDETLDERAFFRASRKHIINLSWVEGFEQWLNGGLMVKLKGGDKVEVSRRQAAKFKDMMSL